MIDEQKHFYKKILKSLTNDFNDWKITKTRHDNYAIENKYNKFKILEEEYHRFTKIVAPEEIHIPRRPWGVSSTLRKKVKRLCKEYDHKELVNQYKFLNELFDIRTVLIFNVQKYAVDQTDDAESEVVIDKLINNLKEDLIGDFQYQICGPLHNELYLYFEKEEDMAYMILKYSDYLNL